MFCVKSLAQAEEIINKSRFIGIIVPCQSEAEIIANLKSQQQRHPAANHIAFAYRLKQGNAVTSRFFDAGEPSGTAGKPILQHLEGKNLINVLLIVIRYFGGIKLGAGGLTRAYGNAAKAAIAAAEVLPFIEYKTLKVELAYPQLQAFEYILQRHGGSIIEKTFTDKIHLVVETPSDLESIIRQEYLDLTQR